MKYWFRNKFNRFDCMYQLFAFYFVVKSLTIQNIVIWGIISLFGAIISVSLEEKYN